MRRTFLGDLFRRETVGGAWHWWPPWSASCGPTPRGLIPTSTCSTSVGPLDVEHWAADGALTLFFFVAGLELKRELVVGSLRRPADAAVPVVAAVCGVAVPALIYLAVNANGGHPEGWAVPAATDIAFALAVLAVVGSNLPTALRAFLLTLAVVDDLIVIVDHRGVLHRLARPPLAGGRARCGARVGVAPAARVTTPLLYVPLAVLAWWAVHESGIHATIAGVVLGLLTRVRHDPGEEHSPAEHLEHVLSPVSSSLAVPFFALMSAGVVIAGGAELIGDPIVIGVVVGLVVGKPVGVMPAAGWSPASPTPSSTRRSAGATSSASPCSPASASPCRCWCPTCRSTGAERDAAKTAVLVGSVDLGGARRAVPRPPGPVPGDAVSARRHTDSSAMLALGPVAAIETNRGRAGAHSSRPRPSLPSS